MVVQPLLLGIETPYQEQILKTIFGGKEGDLIDLLPSECQSMHGPLLFVDANSDLLLGSSKSLILKDGLGYIWGGGIQEQTSGQC